MYEESFKEIYDVFSKDAGFSNELDYIGQTSWILFLKYLDDYEDEKAKAAISNGETYESIIDKEFRWREWAYPKTTDGKLNHDLALTGDDLIEFVNTKLFPYLAGFKLSKKNSRSIDYKIGEVFFEIRNKLKSGYSLRNLINQVNDLNFVINKEISDLKELKELKDLINSQKQDLKLKKKYIDTLNLNLESNQSEIKELKDLINSQKQDLKFKEKDINTINMDLDNLQKGKDFEKSLLNKEILELNETIKILYDLDNKSLNILYRLSNKLVNYFQKQISKILYIYSKKNYVYLDYSIHNLKYLNMSISIYFSKLKNIIFNRDSIKTFNSYEALRYVASNPDLIPTLRTNTNNAIYHYYKYGFYEGRSVDKFDPIQYISKNKKLIEFIGFDKMKATIKFIENYKNSNPISYKNKDINLNKVLNKEDNLARLLKEISSHPLKLCSKPLVSVIIPVYGKIFYTLKCINSISKSKNNTPFEVIVVDDFSKDNTLELLKNVKNLRIVRNKINQGFIRSCNKGAYEAKGKYVLMLNNDTEVNDFWLNHLLNTFDNFPNTGLVGSKLIYPDGRLQEAGGIIWQDGSSWNFGRFKDPNEPQFNYAREVDYCSGASIMIPKELFLKWGGFDETYQPAYCEDSDLAIKLRANGYRVIYQPLSSVIHHEGISSGTDLTKGIKKYQVINTHKQFLRWKSFLKDRPPRGIDVDNAKDRVVSKRLLFLDQCIPTPDQDSGSIDAFNQMLLFRDMGFQVTFIPVSNLGILKNYTAKLQSVGVEVLYSPYITSIKDHLKEFGKRYDLVFIVRVKTFEAHYEHVKKYCKSAKILFHTVDLHFLRMERQAKLMKSDSLMKESEFIKIKEIDSINKADISTVVSSEELKILKSIDLNMDVKYLPFSRSIKQCIKSFKDRKNIMFVGGFRHAPNVDAVKFFVEEIIPLLRPKIPGLKFYIAGSNIPQEILDMKSDEIIVLGFIENLLPLMDKCKLSVAPLRFGAGIKGKIGSSLAAGLPVVATSLAAEGMNVRNNHDILLADSSKDFADQIFKVYSDAELWQQLSKNGLTLAKDKWGAKKGFENLKGVLTDIGINIKKTKYPLKLFEE